MDDLTPILNRLRVEAKQNKETNQTSKIIFASGVLYAIEEIEKHFKKEDQK